MKRFPRLVAFVAALALVAGASVLAQEKPGQAPPAKQAVPDVGGKWVMTLEMSMGTASPSLELKQDGAKLTGTYTGRYGTFPLEGSLKGQAIAFSFNMTAEGQSVTMSFAGEVASDAQSMKGTAVLADMGDASWTAKRQ